MQRGLVDHRTGNQGIAVVFQADGHSVKPVRPLHAQVAFEPDLTDRPAVWIIVCDVFVHFDPFPVVTNPNDRCHQVDLSYG